MPTDGGGRNPRPRSGPPAHSSRPLPRFNRIAAYTGGGAALIAVAVGAFGLSRLPGDTASGPRSFDAITVESEPPTVLPLSDPEILELLDREPEYGPLTEPGRRIGCLTGLGYPAATPILGAREVTINGRSGVVLVLPDTSTDLLTVLAVAANCSSANTGLLATTAIRRP
ncbi:hypothetical protein MU0083_003975 [[Mycobacterium] kokjensenii]|uniref:Alanine rich protein n=1 Tax=[Mycobacterium] kokjensenii TaxID=3064287 RepID=A0ABM9LXX3_9MYCO|nr:hypothetical protein [Mycolicibacter sp. MU0083]CAJ1506557.1 hypothetical protein MU0083_003975 [Mycolicibacter sp. MU0083]